MLFLPKVEGDLPHSLPKFEGDLALFLPKVEGDCKNGPALQERIGVDIQGDGDFLTVVEVGDFLGARIGHQAGGSFPIFAP